MLLLQKAVLITQFMFKHKINNYFIYEVVKSYLFILLTLTILFSVTQATRLLFLITESGLQIETYLEYNFFLLPKTLSQMMLISFLISLFLNISKFQNNKEIEIYWLSGISKKKIVHLIIKISLFITVIASIFYIHLAPTSSLKARQIIGNSEFSFVNSIVKKNNFNSPLKELTIFVRENDNQGNLEKVYIFETNKTIISKKGRVLNINNKNFLELSDGVIHEKNSNNNISTIRFQKTLYDFTNFKTNFVQTPKLQETKFFLLLEEYKKNKNKDILQEIHKRIFKPLFIPTIGILCCFILYTNNEKINLHKIKISIFFLTTFLIIFIEILINLSTSNIFFKNIFYLSPFVLFISLYLILDRFLLSETKT